SQVHPEGLLDEPGRHRLPDSPLLVLGQEDPQVRQDSSPLVLPGDWMAGDATGFDPGEALGGDALDERDVARAIALIRARLPLPTKLPEELLEDFVDQRASLEREDGPDVLRP